MGIKSDNQNWFCPRAFFPSILNKTAFKHEHARPDREAWLNVDLDQTEMDSQFTLIADLNWIQIVDGNGEGLYPYETASGPFSRF